jgi:ElaB/YqjD/DUF883 family membrane-anchored ribosome-binding protein
MKTDPTTKILLGVIATGVAALTAIAFERRYCNHSASHRAEDLKNAASDAYQRVRRNVEQAGGDAIEEAASLHERVGGGVDTLKDKAGSLKERITDHLERVGDHLHAGAERLKDSFRTVAGEAKDGAVEAAEEARRALAASKV